MLVKFAKLVDEKLKKIDHIIYIHADHFEPGSCLIDVCNERLKIWTNDLEKLKIKPSLFVFPSLLMDYRNGEIVTRPSSLTPTIIKYLKPMEKKGADINLHIHHERWTTSSVTTEPWITLLNKKKVTDEQMLITHIIDVKKAFEDVGIDMTSWGFVHGMWGLNASDTRVCNIENEIIILKEHGCFGDFTFPAGRPRCTPDMSGIFSIPNIAGKKIYNKGFKLEKDKGILQEQKNFLIFYPTTSYFYISIDGLLINRGKRAYYYGSTLKPETFEKNGGTTGTLCPEDSLEITQEWILSSMIIDRTMIIKTHAHSMSNMFWGSGDKIENKSPLFQSNHVERMDMLDKGMEERDIKMHYLTARELNHFCIQIDKGESASNIFKEIEK